MPDGTCTSPPPSLPEEALEALQRVWGFQSLRPMQASAIAAALEGRDALVVLPTGGGKSLCYQLPPLVNEKVTVVVSPLIALMRDQVRALELNGYPAAALHSAVEPEEAREIEARLVNGELNLVLAAPERMVTTGDRAKPARVIETGEQAAKAG
ncbi:MAG: DEAD/DEAH box helicase, partial [Planctomycetota bacterium]